MTEYALLAGGIALATAAGYRGLGTSTKGAISSATQFIASANSSVLGGGGSGDHHDRD